MTILSPCVDNFEEGEWPFIWYFNRHFLNNISMLPREFSCSEFGTAFFFSKPGDESQFR